MPSALVGSLLLDLLGTFLSWPFHWETNMGFVIPLAAHYVEPFIHLDPDVGDMGKRWILLGLLTGREDGSYVCVRISIAGFPHCVPWLVPCM